MTATNRKPTERFGDRAADYVRFRPGYPSALVALLKESLGVTPPATVADIGSGTGKFAELLLEAGYHVIGVEPNEPMRLEAESSLRRYPRFESVRGQAEQMPIEGDSVDVVTAAQAFHWFDGPRARGEIRRVLRPCGVVLIIWNERRTGPDPFHAGYERILQRYCPDYSGELSEAYSKARLTEFFHPYGYAVDSFENAQDLDWDGLCGRLRSASYVPQDGPNHEGLFQAFAELFNRCATDGQITIRYDTRAFHGRLANPP